MKIVFGIETSVRWKVMCLLTRVGSYVHLCSAERECHRFELRWKGAPEYSHDALLEALG